MPDASHCETGTANPVYVLAMYLFTPILGFYLLSLRLPLFADRYLIVASPAFYLLLACGLAAVRRRSAAVFGLCLVVVLGSSISSIWAQAHTTIKADFRSAARYFAERTDGREPVVFVIPYAQHTFSYYYRASLAVRQAPYTNGGLPPEQVAARLRAELGGEQRVWVILSEEETYDAHALARAWLDGNGRPAESERFVGVALYRYEVRLQ
ncbi:MAG: hypothetical protein HY331_07375 [Chloroflexi bacterium]|nr:hypothetical protein [Chloroflexota bacterium]